MTYDAAASFPTKRLKYVVVLRRSCVAGSTDARPYIGLENIEPHTGRLIGTAVTDSAAAFSAAKESEVLGNEFECGDVLFGKLRPYLTKAWMAEFSGHCTSEALVMIPLSIEPRFLRYVCLSSAFIDKVDASTFGSKMPRAEWTLIGNISVPVPVREKQRAIADYLDRETARLGALVAAKERMLGLLAEKRRALITRAVTHGLDPDASLRDSGIPWLGKIPAHWKQCHLKRVLVGVDYGVSISVDTEGAIAVLRMGDLSDGELDYSGVGFVEKVDEALLLQRGDLVFNRTNSLDQIGKVALFRGKEEYPVSFASYLVRFRCGPSVLPEFLNYLLNSSFPQAWGRAEALPAIGQANLNPNRFGYLPIALPPLAEQREIVRYISRAASSLQSVRAATEQTITLLKERRSALIAAAITGQIKMDSMT